MENAMTKRRLAFALLLTCFTVATGRQAFSEPNASQAFTPLFQGENPLSGWIVRRWDDVSEPAESRWEFKDGILHGGEPRGSWLLSEREYSDFVLEFEFKLGPLGNSGLALRAPLDGDPAFDGIELQMAELRYNPEAKPSELTGGLYRAVEPSKNIYRSGDWNAYEVTMQGSHLGVRLNGELVQDVDLDKLAQIVKRHDGSDAPALRDRPRRGRIGFQELSRGDEHVLIRNARISELPSE
jgi:hypothetical protein